jgi:hypothetical protein
VRDAARDSGVRADDESIDAERCEVLESTSGVIAGRVMR